MAWEAKVAMVGPPVGEAAEVREASVVTEGVAEVETVASLEVMEAMMEAQATMVAAAVRVAATAVEQVATQAEEGTAAICAREIRSVLWDTDRGRRTRRCSPWPRLRARRSFHRLLCLR